MKIILLGPPGSGKGTQAAFLQKEFGLAKLSTGDMLRAAASADTDFGRQLKSLMASGKLVDDELMIALIRDRIEHDDCVNGFILDGFPRTLAQAEALDIMLREEGKSLDHVIELEVDDAILVGRISGRFACAKCGEGYHDDYKRPQKGGVCDNCGAGEFTRRDDDRADTVAKRLEAYHLQTAPLLPFYDGVGILASVDGMADMEEVRAQIKAILGK